MEFVVIIDSFAINKLVEFHVRGTNFTWVKDLNQVTIYSGEDVVAFIANVIYISPADYLVSFDEWKEVDK